MRRLLAVALVFALALVAAPAAESATTVSQSAASSKAAKRSAAAKRAAKRSAKAKRPKVVCFRKTVSTKSGRKVRKKVCRPRRAKRSLPPRPVAPLAPAAGPAQPQPGTTPSAPGAPAPATATPAPAPAAAACVPEDTEWLTATALDVDATFILRLSRTCLRAGRTIVQYQNQDAQPHDLWAEGVSPARPAREIVASAEPESLEQTETSLTAGEWRLFCSIPGHSTMTRTVTVVP